MRESAKPSESTLPSPGIVTLKTSIREPVDENNTIVLDLINAGYPVDKSVDAVTKYETLEAALEHLQMMEDEVEDNEGEVIPVATRKQFSREVSQEDNFQIEW